MRTVTATSAASAANFIAKPARNEIGCQAYLDRKRFGQVKEMVGYRERAGFFVHGIPMRMGGPAQSRDPAGPATGLLLGDGCDFKSLLAGT